jgi:glycosyltransferase involved in cell wall biosynthesis
MKKLENQEKFDISVVVPIFNEKGNIVKLNSEIQEVISTITDSYEVIYVNDGSTDGSLKELKSLAGHITIINLNRNYGQTTAFDAGFKVSNGELVVSLDGDGQDDPHNIPALIQKLVDDDLDVVAGWRKVRSDKGGICVLTKIGRWLRKKMIHDTIHDSGCALRVYRREAVKSLDIGGEMHRYIMAILRWKGFRIGEVVVNHRKREHGISKYNYSKAIRGFIDLVYIWFLYKFSQRPLHLFGYAGFFLFFAGTFSGLVSIYQKIFFDVSVNRSGYFLVGAFMILTSIIVFSFGIVIDLLIRIQFLASDREKKYYIREIIRK